MDVQIGEQILIHMILYVWGYNHTWQDTHSLKLMPYNHRDEFTKLTILWERSRKTRGVHKRCIYVCRFDDIFITWSTQVSQFFYGTSIKILG